LRVRAYHALTIPSTTGGGTMRESQPARSQGAAAACFAS
jgi:hypothetical protein